jgi:ubiquinone/menaquinone biosynthesis C-methylase UbiE
MAKTVEAGTAGGRILREMKDLGFQELYGYDYVPEFIEQAKQRDASQSISFEVQDATDLTYENSRFRADNLLAANCVCIEEEDKKIKSFDRGLSDSQKWGDSTLLVFKF